MEKIGEGGMGEVWRAMDTSLQREVAIKILPEAFTEDPQRLARFQREARALASINHPSIVTVYSVEESEGIRFFTMELIEGDSLADRIPSTGLSATSLVEMAVSLADALAVAHERGVVHRDLKPANILVSRQSQVKILDFGLAKTPWEATGGAGEQKGSRAMTLTREGEVLGTVPYMSPEQAEGEPVDHRSDIFSLGVILHEAATGRHPFRGRTLAETIASIVRTSPPSVGSLNPEMPRELGRILSRCLEKNPDHRYATVKALRAELETLRASGTTPSDPRPGLTAVCVPSIAVLPFADMSPGEDQEYFCEGIAEELIDGLTKLEGLQVAARASAFQFRGKGHNVREVGEQLQVQTVLEGSIRKAGNRVRITAQLVDIADGFHLWSDKYDRDLDDIFAIQDEISLAIVESLKVRLLGGEKERLVKRRTRDPEAHSLYLKGRYCWNRRYEVGLKKALEFFQRASDKDPLSALPYVGIADSHNVLGWFGFVPANEAYPRAKEAAARALALDDSVGEAHASLGYASMVWDWDWEAAEREFQRAIELAPDHATAHEWYGVLLAVLKRFPEVTVEMTRAQELDPLSLIIPAAHGVMLYMARRHDDAVAELRKVLEMDPTFAFAHAWLGLCLVEKGDREGAREAIRYSTELAPEMAHTLGFLGWVQGMTGREKAARQTLERLDSISDERYVSPFPHAIVHTGLGEFDLAFDYLDKAYTVREPLLVLAHAPFLACLHTDPRFADLLRKIGLQP
jgi:TolB-like protein/Flp pilus assembly protein TadD